MSENTIAGVRFLAAPDATTAPEEAPELGPIEREMRTNRESFERRVAELRDDRDLSDEARARYLEDTYQRARTRYEELAGQKRANIAERLETTRKAAFAPPRLPDSDRAASQLNARDAWYRLRGERDVAKLEQTLEEAELVSDTALCKAVLVRAYQLGNEKLVGAYLATRPAERRKWDEFMDSAQASNAAESTRGRLFADASAPRKPREIGGEW